MEKSKEQVGSCIRCKKDVYCTDGFFNGIILENGNILCFECKENDQLIEILNRLLEAERFGVVTLDYLLKAFPSAGLEASFQQVREDETWSCSGLIHAIQREGGVLGKQVGKENPAPKDMYPREKVIFYHSFGETE